MDNTFLKCGETNLVGLGTLMVSRSVANYLNKGVRGSGLTITQIYAIFLIDKFRGENISFIAKKGIMDRTTLMRILYTIKKYVLIHKNHNLDADARYSYPALTPKGASFLEKWMPVVLELEKGLEIPTGDGEAFIRFANFFSSELVYLNKKRAADKKPPVIRKRPISPIAIPA